MSSGAYSQLRVTVAAAVATVLATLSLGDVFQTGAWFLTTLTVVVVVTAVCELARRVGIPRVLVPLVGLLAVLVVLTVRWGGDGALLGFLPTRESVGTLLDLASSGNRDIARYAAPINPLPGVLLLTVGGVGLVAVLVDTLAVTMRRAAVAGFPLLALYCVPMAVVPSGVSWQAFALGGAGYLFLLLAESRERVSRWGRPLRHSSQRVDWRQEVTETSPLAALGRRVGVAALGLALLVPAVVPGLDEAVFGQGGRFGGAGNGGGRVQVVNPIVDLGRDLKRDENPTVLRYEGPATYLRMTVLDNFNGRTWEPSRLRVDREKNNVRRGLPSPVGLTDGVEVQEADYRIAIRDLEQRWLPLPYWARDVSINGTWVYDRSTFNVFSPTTSTRRQEYRVRAVDVRPTAEQLAAAEDSGPDDAARYLALPTDIPPKIEATARQVVGGAPTAYAKALALQNWFRDTGDFVYSTDAPEVGDGNGVQAIALFLDARRGYCVHYASAMAVMARALGIPARVAVGFLPGQPSAGGRAVRLHDLHSWPELWFQGVGWVRFEPTPATRTGAAPDWAQVTPTGPASIPTGSAAPTATPSGSDSAAARGGRLDDPNDPGLAGAGQAGAAARWRQYDSVVLGVLALVLVGLVPLGTRRLSRRRRWRRARGPAATVLAGWDEVRDVLLDHGRGWKPSDTPRRAAERVVAEAGLHREAAAAMRRLARAVERVRYAAAPDAVPDARAVRSDVRAVADGVAASSPGRVRWRARLLPRSTRRQASALGDRVADMLDGIDRAGAAASARLRPRGRSA